MAGARRRQTPGGFPVGSWGPLGAAAATTINLDLAAQEAASDTLAGTASVLVQLSLDAQEGPDTFSGAVAVLVQAVLSAQEQGQDTFTGEVFADGEPEEGGGASFPFSRPARATALFSSPTQVERAASPPVTAVAEAARLAAAPAPAPGSAKSSGRLLRTLFDQRPVAEPPPAVDATLVRLQVDIILVNMGALLLRLEQEAVAALQAQAQAQAEEEEAIALLLLMAD